MKARQEDGRPRRRNGSWSGWRKLRLAVLERDDWRCHWCGADGRGGGVPMEVDHLYPVSRGGGDDPAGLVAACRRCNRSKHDQLRPKTKRLDLGTQSRAW